MPAAASAPGSVTGGAPPASSRAASSQGCGAVAAACDAVAVPYRPSSQTSGSAPTAAQSDVPCTAQSIEGEASRGPQVDTGDAEPLAPRSAGETAHRDDSEVCWILRSCMGLVDDPGSLKRVGEPLGVWEAKRQCTVTSSGASEGPMHLSGSSTTQLQPVLGMTPEYVVAKCGACHN